MKYVNLVLCVLLVLFVAAQYNDPDGPLWMVIYAIPALWAGITVFRSDLIWTATGKILLSISFISAIFGLAYYWPGMPNWWKSEVWWEQETAREGMGMMIVMVVFLVVFLTAWRSHAHPTHSEH